MVSCFSDACSVVSDGFSCCQVVRMVSGGEDGARGGGGIFNLELCMYSVASFFKEHVYTNTTIESTYIHIVLPRSL